MFTPNKPKYGPFHAADAGDDPTPKESLINLLAAIPVPGNEVQSLTLPKLTKLRYKFAQVWHPDKMAGCNSATAGMQTFNAEWDRVSNATVWDAVYSRLCLRASPFLLRALGEATEKWNFWKERVLHDAKQKRDRERGAAEGMNAAGKGLRANGRGAESHSDAQKKKEKEEEERKKKAQEALHQHKREEAQKRKNAAQVKKEAWENLHPREKIAYLEHKAHLQNLNKKQRKRKAKMFKNSPQSGDKEPHSKRPRHE
ncbi:hypothetical protein CF327_g1775 [Tilletia walkeri]|nr:hypothetical protein CF327_g1775 [Tilletia walkeri]